MYVLCRIVASEALINCENVFAIVGKLLFIVKFDMVEISDKTIMKTERFYTGELFEKTSKFDIFVRDFAQITFFSNFIFLNIFVILKSASTLHVSRAVTWLTVYRSSS